MIPKIPINLVHNIRQLVVKKGHRKIYTSYVQLFLKNREQFINQLTAERNLTQDQVCEILSEDIIDNFGSRPNIRYLLNHPSNNSSN